MNYTIIQTMLERFKAKFKGKYLVGIDLETGGINDSRHSDDPRIPIGMIGADFYPILQVAVIVYDNNFKEVGKPLNIVIHQTEEILEERVSDWSKKQFKDTLMKQCPKSKITLEQAEKMIVEHLNSFGIKETDSADGFLFGNSIRLDMEFISAQMRDLKNILHYRLADVSSFKTIFGFMFGEYAVMPKKESHDALEDIRESFLELLFYLDRFVISPEAFARSLMIEERPEPFAQKDNEVVFVPPFII